MAGTNVSSTTMTDAWESLITAGGLRARQIQLVNTAPMAGIAQYSS